MLVPNPVLSLALLLVGSGGAHAQGAQPRSDQPKVSSLRELWPALTGCFRPPADSAGSEITVRFSLDRNGVLIGKPAITFSKLVGTQGQRQAFVEAALGSLQQCTPAHVTPGMGGAVAGRPLTIHYVGGRPAKPI